MTIAIVDYGMSNLCSVTQALTKLGATPVIAEQPEQLHAASAIVLPGVGGFSEGMANLASGGWILALQEQVAQGKSLLGICLGMQLLASRGTEGAETPGLDLVPGEIVRLDELGCTERVPHVGWNNVLGLGATGGLFDGIPENSDFYFVHSYAFRAVDAADVLAFTDYGTKVTAAVRRGKVFGTQFHPEKSSRAGFRLLRNFLELAAC